MRPQLLGAGRRRGRRGSDNYFRVALSRHADRPLTRWLLGNALAVAGRDVEALMHLTAAGEQGRREGDAELPAFVGTVAF